MARPSADDLLPNGCTHRQELFCMYYVGSANFDDGKAYIAAGYKGKAAPQSGYSLRKLPAVKARILELLKERQDDDELLVKRLKNEYERLAFADPTEMIKSMKDGKIIVKDLSEIPQHLRIAIKSWKPTKEGLHITFHEKTAAMEQLGRHLGFFEEDNKQKAPEGPQIYLPDNGRGDAAPAKEDS